MAGENTPQDSSLGLSDDEFLKQGPALLAAASAAADTSGTKDDNQEDEAEKARLAQEESDRVAAEQAANADQSGQGGEPGDAGSAAAKAAAGEDTEGKEDGKEKTEEVDDSVGNPGEVDPTTGKKRGADGKFIKVPVDDKAGKDDQQQQQAATIDYKAEYERLTAPFKANGRDIRVDNVDEAVRLMQMGANYNRKMAALKPNLAIMKTLENNGLLTQEKINFLIDLDKKNPEAISKLIKESGIDPLDISAEKAGEYKPGNHSVKEVEVELDTVLDDIKDSPKINETLDVVGKQWDTKSRQLIAAQPQLIKVINGHMESGVYDLVAAELERKKLFGGLEGLSDLEAYRQVGDAMAAEGKFTHITSKPGQAAPNGQQTPAVRTVVPLNPKKADDSKRDEQRRAAAPVKVAAPSGKLPADFNPLALSDEEFAKFKPKF